MLSTLTKSGSYRTGTRTGKERMYMRWILGVSVIGMLSPASVNALELTEDLEVHGFLSQAYIHTSDNNFFGRSDGGSFDFREVGLNAFWRVNGNLHLAGQVLSRNAGRESDSSPRIDFALADIHYYPSFSTRIGSRLGRIKIPLGLYNQTRDAPSARNGIFTPSSVYFEQFRNALVSSDGASLYAQINKPWGNLDLELYSVKGDPGEKEMEYFVFKQDTLGKFDDASLHGAQVRYESMGGGIHLAFSYSRPSLDYSPLFAFNPMQRGDVISDMLIFSGQYNTEHWTITAEHLLMINNVKNFGPVFSDFRAKGESYYVQADYRYRPDLTLSLRYDEQIINDEDRDGDKRFNPAHVGFGKSWMIGARWDFAPGWFMRAEVHRTDGTAWLSGTDNPNPSDTNRKWKTYALQLVYSF